MARKPSFPVQLDKITPARPTAAGGAARPSAAAPDRGLPVPAGVGLDSAPVRLRMVERLRAEGIADAQVLRAMTTVERHRFVDTALVNQAYEDTSLPIGHGQTISKPSVVARMVELLLAAPVFRTAALGAGPSQLRVLEIGTGCGYQAAVLSKVVPEVYSIERVRALHERARHNLRALRLPNLHLLFGDGMPGYPGGAPYAGIVSAAGGRVLPQAWIEQLAVGGRIIAPTETPGGQQALLVVDRTAHGVEQRVLEAVHFVPLKSGIE